MTNEYVAVPKVKLEQLEKDREKLYELLGNVLDNQEYYQENRSLAFGELLGITGNMWLLGNRKWHTVSLDNTSKVDNND